MHWRSGNESSREGQDGSSSEIVAQSGLQLPLSQHQFLYRPGRPTLRLLALDPSPETNNSTPYFGAGQFLRLRAPPAGCGTASPSAPGPLVNGRMRFGGDSTIVIRCVATIAQFCRASGISVIFARRLPLLSPV